MIPAIAVLGWLAVTCQELRAADPVPTDDRAVRRGQYGGDLELLRTFYEAPTAAGESNHHFDLWEPGSLGAFSRLHGLTNNHTLFIDSHGVDRFSWKGRRHVFRPRAAAIPSGRKSSTYSIRDMAQVMGEEAAATIHNVVVAGCNEGGSFRAAEVRQCFGNATNVVYMAPGQLAYKPVFYQVLTRHSEDIQPLYGKVVSEAGTGVKAQIYQMRVEGAERLGSYLAELFEPGAEQPYRRQRAGRELLEPGFSRAPALRADNASILPAIP